MKLTKVYARFYKSFNYDYRRKAHEDGVEQPWETTPKGWYPYIEVPIHALITTIVGANESGKSHLLNAMEIAISGKGFRHQDLCRYCDFFNVEIGNSFWPHLGVAWGQVSPEDQANIREAAAEAPETFDHFLMFREGPDVLDLYFPDGNGGFRPQRLVGEAAKTFGQTFLPKPFTIKADIALPRALPVSEISPDGDGKGLTRPQRAALIRVGQTVHKRWTKDAEALAGILPQMVTSMVGDLNAVDEDQPDGDQEKRRLSYELARRLLVQLGKVEPERLKELAGYLDSGEDGHAAALAQSISTQLERELNFPKYWVQDRDFQILVTPHDTELAFTIRDRTGTQYTFDERSAGLRYFLSYFIQAQTHEPHPTRPEILLMDEPDAYLSAEAQQDLLKIFSEFAEPTDGAQPIQVVYVTHSPFLLDKNHSERIRVLQKGKGVDGTRVIRTASQNHYEPLRSAIGAYVGETAFVGSSNLLVEGAADQVLLAGMSRLLQDDGPIPQSEILDLNRTVLVPCGGAKHVPYMIFLVRGRDQEPPPVVVLLDSDKDGRATLVEVEEQVKQRLIGREFVADIASLDLAPGLPSALEEPEDLIPPKLAIAAANRYFAELAEHRVGAGGVLDLQAFQARLNATTGVWDALKATAADTGLRLDKLGFARAVIEVCKAGDATHRVELATFKTRMRKLFSELNSRIRRAELEQVLEKAGAKVERHRKVFVRDHPNDATKEQAQHLFERIDQDLDQSIAAESIRAEIIAMKRKFQLDGDPLDQVPDYDAFLLGLQILKEAFVVKPEPVTASAPKSARRPTGAAKPASAQPARARKAQKSKVVAKAED